MNSVQKLYAGSVHWRCHGAPCEGIPHIMTIEAISGLVFFARCANYTVPYFPILSAAIADRSINTLSCGCLSFFVCPIDAIVAQSHSNNLGRSSNSKITDTKKIFL